MPRGPRESAPSLPRSGVRPEAARNDRPRGETFGAAGRARLGVAAMVAQEPPGIAMLDQPCGAIRALEAMTAGAAQGQGRVAAPIEKQQRLLAGRECRCELGDEIRRQKPPGLEPLAAHVD